MEQEANKPQVQEVDNSDSFITKVTEFFIKLMDNFTKGKYNTPEEQAFFADEKNLYDEKGNITPEYQKKIEEFEEYVRNNSVDGFLKEVHGIDSEDFGTAYSESENQILLHCNTFIVDQERIKKELEKSRLEKSFDFDTWFEEYAKLNNWGEEERKKMQEYILEIIDEMGKNGNDVLNTKDVIRRVIDETK